MGKSYLISEKNISTIKLNNFVLFVGRNVILLTGKVSGRDVDCVKYKLLGKRKNFVSYERSVTFHFTAICS